MSLATLHEVLIIAEKEKSAIPAFTVDTLEVAEEIASAAEANQCPVIMMVGQNTFRYHKLKENFSDNSVSGRIHPPTSGAAFGSWNKLRASNRMSASWFYIGYD